MEPELPRRARPGRWPKACSHLKGGRRGLTPGEGSAGAIFAPASGRQFSWKARRLSAPIPYWLKRIPGLFSAPLPCCCNSECRLSTALMPQDFDPPFVPNLVVDVQADILHSLIMQPHHSIIGVTV